MSFLSLSISRFAEKIFYLWFVIRFSRNNQQSFSTSLMTSGFFRISWINSTALLTVILSITVEMRGFEPLTPCLQGRCSPNWATPPWFWHPPAFPCRLQHSIIGRTGLNHRVRDGNGCAPCTHRHQKLCEAMSKCRIYRWADEIFIFHSGQI